MSDQLTGDELKAVLPPRLPTMWNALWTTGVVVLFAGGALVVQAVVPTVDYGEAEWGLIGVVATKLLDAMMKVVDYYTSRRSE